MRVDDGTIDDAGDRRLIARITARDRSAFEDFYGIYARRVLTFVRDIVGTTELAEEVTSDVLVVVWQSAHRFRGQSRIATWVLGIAHHKAVDAIRRRGDPPLGLGQLAERESDEPGPSDELLRSENRTALDRALNRLSAEHRTVLQLMYGFGCSQAEIADIVGCPVATVKTRVFYAKRRLRDELSRTATVEELA